jgi:hypothetical protein
VGIVGGENLDLQAGKLEMKKLVGESGLQGKGIGKLRRSGSFITLSCSRDTVAKFNWDSKVPFDQFDARSIDNARNASENQGYRGRFLASIRKRLGIAAVKGQALDPCQELFLADGVRSDEEDDVFQNLRKLLQRA